MKGWNSIRYDTVSKILYLATSKLVDSREIETIERYKQPFLPLILRFSFIIPKFYSSTSWRVMPII